MTGDSVSNFLDVTAAHRAAMGAAAPDPELGRRAEVLAKLSEGVTSVDGLAKRTELSEEATRSALEWLSDQGLVQVVSRPDGEERIKLPKSIREALE